jgi:hypothetical protein
MATPSLGGSAHGTTSMAHAHALPARPVDKTVPTTHRSRRDRSAHAAAATEVRMGFVASTALAVVSLVFVLAVALGSTLASASILHAISPDRHFDAFRALHEPLAVALLFGLGVLWLLPPHPWAMEPGQSGMQQRRLVSARAAA